MGQNRVSYVRADKAFCSAVQNDNFQKKNGDGDIVLILIKKNIHVEYHSLCSITTV